FNMPAMAGGHRPDLVPLATGAGKSSPLRLYQAAERRSAGAARPVGATIDEAVHLKIPRCASTHVEIPQRTPACRDRVEQGGFDRRGKTFRSFQANSLGGCGRVDARSKQAFRGVYIADADHDVAREQRLLDGSVSPSGRRIQIGAVERIV